MSSDKAKLSLQSKVSITLFAIMAAQVIIGSLVLDAVVAPAFSELENDAALKDVRRAERAIGAELRDLVRLSRDWGPWDDTFKFVRGEYPGFEQSNLTGGTLDDLGLNLLLFYDLDRRLHWGQLLIDDKLEAVASTGVFGTESTVELGLQDFDNDLTPVSGLLQTDRGLALLVSHPITQNNDGPPIGGTIVLGRLLDDARLADFRQRTAVEFEWIAVQTEAAPDQVDLSLFVSEGADFVKTIESGSQIESYKLLNDLQGQPAMLLRTATSKKISALGSQALKGASIIMALALLLTLLVIWLLLNKMIVAPIDVLRRHISEIRKSGDLGKRLRLSRNDEIGVLAANFDELTKELEDARHLVLEQSFKAGKADAAAEILHNIRNAMTPVINGVDRLGMVCSVTAGLKVKQAVAQLQQGETDESRRDKLIQYIDSAFRHVEEAHKEGDRELKAVSRQARQVEAILADQEKYAKAGPMVEEIALGEMVDEAVLVLPKRKKPRINLSVEADVKKLRVRGHRVGLMQVIGNLVLNAYEAIQRSEATEGSICVSAQSESEAGQEMVRLTVRDSGCGFATEARQKIFQRGFSSKNGNLSGLGLHWCANALAGMGGRILAESPGNGEGASFHVLLPAATGASR